jgi:hypothetical protein
MKKIKYVVKAHPAGDKNHIVEETLNSRELRERWIAKIKENGWKVTGQYTKVVG